MMTRASSAGAAAPAERREHFRVTFSPVQRPRLSLPDGVHEILDASLGGVRIRHTDPVRPQLGQRVAGSLEWSGRARLPLSGTIVRVMPTEVAVACDDGLPPLGHILSETARRRDGREQRPSDG